MAKIKNFLEENRGRISVMLLGSTIILIVLAIGMKFWIFGVGSLVSFVLYTLADPRCKTGYANQSRFNRYKDNLPGSMEDEIK